MLYIYKQSDQLRKPDQTGNVRKGYWTIDNDKVLTKFILKGFIWKTFLVYLDDVMVNGKTFEDNWKNFREVFSRCTPTAEPEKLFNIQNEVHFLGKVKWYQDRSSKT